MVAGLAPRELAPFIAGAPLMALVKQGGGLRPIAIGETIRRLVSKCCCEATTEDAKVIFGPCGYPRRCRSLRACCEEVGAGIWRRSRQKVYRTRSYFRLTSPMPLTSSIAQRCWLKSMRSFLVCTGGLSIAILILRICSLAQLFCKAWRGFSKVIRSGLCCSPLCFTLWH